MELSGDQVQALAPDAASLKAAGKLTSRSKWPEAGRSDSLLWGRCSGSRDYEVKIIPGATGYHCTCPSRKFPCKHVLALLMLVANDPATVPDGSPPDWASDWLDKRVEKAEKKAANAAAPPKPVDAKAQARRAAARDDKVAAGLDRLDLWLQDRVRDGLASLATDYGAFHREAQRLGDAQAPTLAREVESMAGLLGSGDDWPGRLLERFGQVKWLIEAFRHLDRLPPRQRAIVRGRIGYPVSAAELAADGEPVADRWAVVGQETDELDAMQSRTTWLLGRRTGRSGYLLEFARPPQSFEHALIPGSEFDDEVRFYPFGSSRLKVGQPAGLGPLVDLLPGVDSVQAMLDDAASQRAVWPWDDRVFVSLRQLRAADPRAKRGTRAVDAAGDSIKLAGIDRWSLLALTGGQPFDAIGHWNGQRLAVLGILCRGRFSPASSLA